jgi:hypothetical protein
MIIDIKTALRFIDNRFENYTNKDFIDPGKTTYTFNRHNWTCNNIHKYTMTGDYIDILDMDSVCIWNHHNMYDENTVNSFNRRAQHLLDCLHKTPDTLLLFYIEKIQKYGEKDSYFDKHLLDKYNCHFLILIPLLDFNQDPFLFYEDTKLRIIYFNSNLELWGTHIHSHIDEWNKLKILINQLYNLTIENRE